MTTPRRTTSKQVAKQTLVAQRRAKAADLKHHNGWSNIQVGRYLAADPALRPPGAPPLDEVTGQPDGWPQGYGIESYLAGQEPPSDYQLSRMVSEDLRRGYADASKERTQAIDAMREEMEANLAALRDVAYRKALDSGDPQAITAYLKVEERRAKVWGLDEAKRTEITGRNGGPLEVRSYTDADLVALLDAVAGTPGSPEALTTGIDDE